MRQKTACIQSKRLWLLHWGLSCYAEKEKQGCQRSLLSLENHEYGSGLRDSDSGSSGSVRQGSKISGAGSLFSRRGDVRAVGDHGAGEEQEGNRLSLLCVFGDSGGGVDF